MVEISFEPPRQCEMLRYMKRSLATLCLSGIFSWFCDAQDYSRPAAGVKPGMPEMAKPGQGNADQPAYYATLARQVLESNIQFELLNQLAQEHRKRAEETPRDQGGKYQWESDLAKELGDKASAVLQQFNTASKERVALEQAHPEIAASLVPNSVAGGTNGANPDEIVFLGKLDEMRMAVQQELAATIEAGRLSAAQLRTNTGAYDFSRVAAVLQDNGNAVRQLQKELSDLELKELEFRALRKR